MYPVQQLHQAWGWPQSQGPTHTDLHTLFPHSPAATLWPQPPDPCTNAPSGPHPCPAGPPTSCSSSNDIWPPDAISMLPTLLVPSSHHPQGTFNVTGLSLPSDTTGSLGQGVERQWREMGALVLGSRCGALQERGVRATTRRGGVVGKRGLSASRSPGFGGAMCRQFRKSSHLWQRAPFVFISRLEPPLLWVGQPRGPRLGPTFPTWESVQHQSLGRHRAH